MEPGELIRKLRDRADTAEDACRADGDDDVYAASFVFDRQVADALEAALLRISLMDEGLADLQEFNERFSRVVENETLSVESKNLAIGMLATLAAPRLRKLAALSSAVLSSSSLGER